MSSHEQPDDGGRRRLGAGLGSSLDPLALGLAGLVAAFLVVTPVTSGAMLDAGPGLLFSLVAGLVVVGTVALVTRYPVVGTAVMLTPFPMAIWTRWFAWGWLLALICAMVAVAYRRGWRLGLVPAVGALVVSWWYCSTDLVALLPIGPVTSGFESGYGLASFGLYAFWIAAVLATVLAARAWRRAQESQRDATERRTQADAVATLAAERSRMARDLHDVVAHHISLIAVRTESAPYQHDLDAPTRALLAEIGDDARAALGELRHALAVLHRADGEPVPTRPQPTAADVDALVREARAAGQVVDDVGSWGTVPAPTGYVLHRAVQEGLTNARRHAPGEPVAIRRSRTDRAVVVEITNPSGHPDGPLEQGRGLLGMAERVAAVDGAMTAVVDGGVARVEVRVPVGEAA